MTLNAYLNKLRSLKSSNRAMSWNAWYMSTALFPVVHIFWLNNMVSAVENTSSKTLETPFPRLKMTLDVSALKNLFLRCEFQSHILFTISLLFKNFLTALLLMPEPYISRSPDIREFFWFVWKGLRYKVYYPIYPYRPVCSYSVVRYSRVTLFGGKADCRNDGTEWRNTQNILKYGIYGIY